MNIKETIKEVFVEVLELTDSKLKVPELKDDVILLDSGLDSLGFAILVARLDEMLGYDPFTIMTEPIYPTTFGEFTHIYQTNMPTD